MHMFHCMSQEGHAAHHHHRRTDGEKNVGKTPDTAASQLLLIVVGWGGWNIQHFSCSGAIRVHCTRDGRHVVGAL